MPEITLLEDKPIPGSRGWTQRITDENGNPSTTIIFYKMVDQPVDLTKLQEQNEKQDAKIRSLWKKQQSIFAQWRNVALNKKSAPEAYYAYVEPRVSELTDKLERKIISKEEFSKGLTAIMTMAMPSESEKLRDLRLHAINSDKKYNSYVENQNAIVSRLHGFVEDDNTRCRVITPFSGPLAEKTRAALKEIEGVADIRYFDITSLTEEDRTYLAAHRMPIPKRANLELGYLENSFNKKNPTNKSGDTKETDEDKLPRVIGLASLAIDDYAGLVISSEAEFAFDHVIRHELLHTLNFDHLNSSRIFSENRESAEQNTVIAASVNKVQTTLRLWDIERLQQVYGPSKNPSNLPQQLAAEERYSLFTAEQDRVESQTAAFHQRIAQESVNKLVIPALTAELQRLTRDKKLDDADLKKLREKAIELKQNVMGTVYLPEDLGLTLQSIQNNASRDVWISGAEFFVKVEKVDVSNESSLQYIPLFPTAKKTPGDLPPR